MTQRDVKVIDRETLNKYIEAQLSVPKGYSPKRQDLKEIEQSSAQFLQDFIDGKIKIKEDAFYLWPIFVKALKDSRYQGIQNRLEKADNTYKIALITACKKEQRWKSLCANNYAILQKKKELDKLTSEDLLVLADALDKDTSHNTTKQKDKLRGIIQNRIDEVLKGKREQDEDFGRLVDERGSNPQRRQFETRKAPKPIVQEVKIEEPIVVMEDKPLINPRAEELSAHNFGILNKNKNTINKLSSEDLLLMAEMLDNEKGFDTRKLKDKLRSIIQNRINETLKGERPQDDCFERLVAERGSTQQKQRFANKKDERPSVIIINGETTTPLKTEEKKQQAKKTPKQSWFAKAWQKTKRVAVVAGIAVLGLIGINKCGSSQTNNDTKVDNQAPKVENVTHQQQSPVLEVKEEVKEEAKTVEQQSDTVKTDDKTADFSKEQADFEQKYKEHVQSFLAIHKVDGEALISKINKLAEDGKIQFADGTNAEWYAHAFTVYGKVAPNSKETKMIKDLMAGQDVNPQEINQLVVQAKRDGTGVKGHGKYSAYNHSSKEKQAKYRKTLKDVRTARMAMEKAQHSH